MKADLVPGGVFTFRKHGTLYAILAVIRDENNNMNRVFSVSVFRIEDIGIGFDYAPTAGAGVQWKPLSHSYRESHSHSQVVEYDW